MSDPMVKIEDALNALVIDSLTWHPSSLLILLDETVLWMFKSLSIGNITYRRAAKSDLTKPKIRKPMFPGDDAKDNTTQADDVQDLSAEEETSIRCWELMVCRLRYRRTR